MRYCGLVAKNLELRLDPGRDRELITQEDGAVEAHRLDVPVDPRAGSELGVPSSREAKLALAEHPEASRSLGVDVVLGGHRGPVRHEAVQVQDAVADFAIEHVSERGRGLSREDITPEAHAELLVEGADLAGDHVLATNLGGQAQVLHRD